MKRVDLSEGQFYKINEEISVKVLKVKGNKRVVLGIEAPPHIKVFRPKEEKGTLPYDSGSGVTKVWN